LLGIHVYYDASDRANCIEAHTSVPDGKVTLILHDHRLEAPSVGELREISSLIQHAHPVNDFDSGLEIPGIGLCVYSHDYENDNSRADAISVIPPV
jgi:hypothetical protein